MLMDTRDPAVRILIADDHTILREGLRRLLETETGFAIVAEASDGVEAIRLARELRPDVVLLDVAMPRLSGVEALPALVECGCRPLLLTAAIDAADLVRCIQLGARGIVLKEAATRQLIDGVHRVMSGRYVIGSGLADNLAEAVRQIRVEPSRYALTSRELDIVGAVVRGSSNREIAREFSISLQTVKHHLTSIFDKTGTSSRLELALFALRKDLVNSDR
jgi:two-component system, NarL family, nitrate/nitrite response regulator NarL